MKIQLEDKERALIRRLRARVGYVGVVEFRGPRGRQYLPVRTEVCVLDAQVDKAVERIRGKQYRNGAFPTRSTVHTVDALGNVKGSR